MAVQASIPVMGPDCCMLTSKVSGVGTPKESGLNRCWISHDVSRGAPSVAGPVSCSVVPSLPNHCVLTSRGCNRQSLAASLSLRVLRCLVCVVAPWFV